MVRALENEGVETRLRPFAGRREFGFSRSASAPPKTSSYRRRVIAATNETGRRFNGRHLGHRLTRPPGVCSAAGQGTTTSYRGSLRTAGGMPMVIITGQKPILEQRRRRLQINRRGVTDAPMHKAATREEV